MKFSVPVSRTILPKFSALKDFSIQILPYWVAAALTGLVAVLFAKAFSFSESVMESWAVPHPAYAFFMIPLGMLASLGLTRVFAPFASGSGIPQLIAALDISARPNTLVKKLLGWKVVIVKFVATCVGVAGGGVSGREGPMLQISAGLFRLVQKNWPKVGVKFDPQSVILAGGAAGLAAAFNTPLGGVIFAVEELAKVHISNIRTTVFHAVIISGLIAQALLGNYLYLSKISFAQYNLSTTFYLVLAAALIGMIGAGFGVFLLKANDFRVRLGTVAQVAMTLVCGLIVASIFFFTTPDSLGAGRQLITKLILHPDTHAGLVLSVSRVLTNYFTHIGGVAGGIFAPSLASGAAFGSWLSQFVASANPEVWILAGMVAFLTGVTRTPFTSLVLVLEMTDSHGIVFDLMLAAVFAHGAARLIDPVSFYEHMAHRIIAGHKALTGEAGHAQETPHALPTA